jgi:hypothetical protein
VPAPSYAVAPAVSYTAAAAYSNYVPLAGVKSYTAYYRPQRPFAVANVVDYKYRQSSFATFAPSRQVVYSSAAVVRAPVYRAPVVQQQVVVRQPVVVQRQRSTVVQRTNVSVFAGRSRSVERSRISTFSALR